MIIPIEKASKRAEPATDGSRYQLRPCVAGRTPKSVAALANLTRICKMHLGEGYSVEVIDLLGSPTLAAADHILAIPTLVRRLPGPVKKIIGDLSNEEPVLVGLDIRALG